MKLWNERWPQSLWEFNVLVHLSLIFFGVWRVLPYVRLDRLLRWLHSADKTFVDVTHRFMLIERYLEAMFYRFRTNPKGDCLVRSLVLFYFARREGMPVQFHCGVCQGDEDLRGHAWLSLYGEPFSEKGDNPFAQFVVTYSFPDSQSDLNGSDEAEPCAGRGAAMSKDPMVQTLDLEH